MAHGSGHVAKAPDQCSSVGAGRRGWAARLGAAAVLAALGLASGSCRSSPGAAGPAPTERACPEPLGKIVLEDCEVVAAKYDELRFAGASGVQGAGRGDSVLEVALSEADRSLAYLRHERQAACAERSACRLTEPEYRDALRRLDEAYLGLLQLHEDLVTQDAQRALELVRSLRALREGWPRAGDPGLVLSGVDGKHLPHFLPQPSGTGFSAFAGLDYPDSDLQFERGHTAATCAKFCERRGPVCAGFVMGSGSTEGHCWLKSDFLSPRAIAKRTAFVRSTMALSQYVLVPDIDAEGEDLPPTDATTPAACAERCGEAERCVGFVFSIERGGECSLKQRIGKLTLRPGARLFSNPAKGATP
jgi:hypothetical protein